MGKLRVLMLEDNPDDAQLLALALRGAGIDCEWTRVQTREKFRTALRELPDIVLSDYSLPGFDALDALRVLAETGLEIPVIVVTGVMSEEACVECLRRGAIDYLLKDRLARLGPAVEHALHQQRLRVGRLEAEQAARRVSAMLRGVIDNSPSAIYVKDGGGRYVIANAKLEEILGLEPGSAIGRTDGELLPPAVAGRLTTLDRGCVEEDSTDEREEQFGADDARRTYLSVRYPIHIEGEAASAVGGILTDITVQKHIESDLRSTRAELRVQAAHLEQDNLDLQELDRVKAEFLESVSHELRTPLSLINGTIEMILDGDLGQLTAEERTMVTTMERAGSRLYSTILDLLTVFQMDRGGFTLNVRPTQLVDVIRQALHTLEPMLAPAGHQVGLDLPPALPLVPADPDQIGRVLLNLMSNAVKFTSPGDRISVSARSQGSEVLVSVRDTGVGIPRDEQAQAFLKFHRGRHALKQASQGAGVGLAICKEIIEGHHGWIDLESEPGGGTTVTFGLPDWIVPPDPPTAEPASW